MMPEVTTSPRSILWERTVAVIKGAFCFFPGFLLSLPFTAIWARRQCPGEAQCVLIAIIPSFFIGVAFAIAYMAWLLSLARVGELTDQSREIFGQSAQPRRWI